MGSAEQADSTDDTNMVSFFMRAFNGEELDYYIRFYKRGMPYAQIRQIMVDQYSSVVTQTALQG